MAELVDARGLGPRAERRRGSNPLLGTLHPCKAGAQGKLRFIQRMKGIASILRQVTIEEYVSILISFAFALVLLWGFREHINRGVFAKEFIYYVLNGGYFLGLFLVGLLLYFFIKFYVSVSRFLTKRIVDKVEVSFAVLFSVLARGTLSFFRITVTFLAPFTLSSFLLSIWTFETASRLLNDVFMNIDEELIGSYPFISLHAFSVPGLEALIPKLVIVSFLGLGFVMGVTGFLLYVFSEKRWLYSGYVVSILMVLAFSMPLWFFFPAVSPQNAYIDNVYETRVPPDIAGDIETLKEDPALSSFFERVRALQEARPPISTMPSMHVAWALITIYFLLRLSPRTSFVSLPWFFFSSLGTVYLAQHYFIDVVVALFLTGGVIIFSGYLARRWENSFGETKFWQEFRGELRDDLWSLFAIGKKITRTARERLV